MTFWNDFLNYGAAIVTILGLPIILWQLWANERQTQLVVLQERRQLIECLTAILEPIGHWARADKGGYPQTMLQELMSNKELQTPLYRVFHLVNPLSSIFTLRGIIHFDDSFQKALVGLNQAIVSFHSRLEFIERFVFSKPDLATEIIEDGNLSPEALNFRDMIHMLQIELHTDGIGDDKVHALHYWHKLLLGQVQKAKSALDGDAMRYHNIWYRRICPKGA
jgi:hypothetical protein